MPRRQILSQVERSNLLAVPQDKENIIRLFTLSERDISIIEQYSRGKENRLGFAVQLCYIRYPGVLLAAGEEPSFAVLDFVGSQISVDPGIWKNYSERAGTRREHLISLQSILGMETFSSAVHHKSAVDDLQKTALQTEKGIVLATELLENLRFKKILIPAISTIESICAEAITRASRSIYLSLTEFLSDDQKKQLDELLLVRNGTGTSTLLWLREPPSAFNARHLLEHIDRLEAINHLNLPKDIEKRVHQNRLLKIAREGGQMTAQHLADFEETRRRATVLAVVLEAKATLIDEIVDIHDRIIGSLFNKAKITHEQDFQRSGKDINEKVRLFWKIGMALLEAKETGEDPFSAIEAIIPWKELSQSISEAGQLSRPESLDYLHLLANYYSQIHRYTPALLNTLALKAAPVSADILKAIEIIKTLNTGSKRDIPKNAPTGFVRKRWQGLVFNEGGIDKKFYELCVFSELKNALRSGDIWVEGSRQFKDFEEYLLPADKFLSSKENKTMPLGIETDMEIYLNDRITALNQLFEKVNELSQSEGLTDVSITGEGLKIYPLAGSVPNEADPLMKSAYGLMPRVKITDLLLEVDGWTRFTDHFTHMKSGEQPANRTLLMTAILSDAINLGLRKMAESAPGTTYAKLSWLQAWHIRDETYEAALANLVNAQLVHPFAAHWGDGTTSSSDGQRFRTSGHAGLAGNINPNMEANQAYSFTRIFLTSIHHSTRK